MVLLENAPAGTQMSGGYPANIYPEPELVIGNHSAFTREHYGQRILEFKADPVRSNDIVFIGDSITEQGGNWNQRLDETNIKNRGISGDVTDGVLKRLGEVNHFKPVAVFLLIGINDLFNSAITSGYVSNNILQIAQEIHSFAIDTKIFVQTILPTGNWQLSKKILRTNQMLLAAEALSNVTVINTYSFFANEQELINPEFTHDGVHLTEAGYLCWTAVLKQYIQRIG